MNSRAGACSELGHVTGRRVQGVCPASVVIAAYLVSACALGAPPVGHGSESPAALTTVIAYELEFAQAVVQSPSLATFGIRFENRDPGILHNLAIVSEQGGVVFRGETFAGIETRSFLVAPLAAGSYSLRCDVHPTMSAALEVAPRR
jgi:hypothetical protein